MVYLTMTPALVTALNELDRFGLDIGDAYTNPVSAYSLVRPTIGNPISHDQVIRISKLLRQSQINISIPYHLDDLLRGSKLYQESSKPKAEPTSSYKALMARLRQEEEARAYERMINPLPPTETFADRFPSAVNAKIFLTGRQEDVDEDDEVTYADIDRQMALIINILVSIVACSVAIWMVSGHWSTPKRLGLSMGGSGMVGVGEIVVYAGYIRRLKEARKKGQKQVEIKEIIKTWVIGGDHHNDKQENVKAITSKLSTSETVRRRKAK